MAILYRLGTTLLSNRMDGNASYLFDKKSFISAKALSIVEDVGIPRSHISLLEAYTGPAHLVPALVSHPLKAVHLFGDLTLDLLPTDAASASSVDEAVAHLRELNLGAAPDRPTILAAAFPNLVCLRLMMTRALWDPPDLVFYSRIASPLRSMSRLVAFELPDMYRQSCPMPPFSPVKAEEKEWITPPASPTVVDAEHEGDKNDLEDRGYDFDGAFQD